MGLKHPFGMLCMGEANLGNHVADSEGEGVGGGVADRPWCGRVCG